MSKKTDAQILEIAKIACQIEVLWEYEFETTRRKNGDVILKYSPRDTEDEAKGNFENGYSNSFQIISADKNGIELTNTDPQADIIEFFRPELAEIIEEELIDSDIFSDLIIEHLKTLQL
jgi:hypothetical protein